MKDDKGKAIQFTQEVVADIWEQHENQARLRELTEELWENHRQAAFDADCEGRLEGYAFETLDVSVGEAQVVAALYRQMDRDRAQPADDPPDTDPMYK